MIASGHAQPFKYTVKTGMAFVKLARKRKGNDLADQLLITRNAYHENKQSRMTKLLKGLRSGNI